MFFITAFVSMIAPVALGIVLEFCGPPPYLLHKDRIGPEWTSSGHLVGAGNFDPGKWRVGNYEVDVYINTKKAATGYFEIY